MEESITYVEHPTFETVWETLQQISKMQDKFARESERRYKRMEKKLGDHGNRFGEMVEHMVMPCMVPKFHELGFEFTKATRRVTIKDEKNNIITEIDITLEDGDNVMIIEVKTKPTTEDIRDHIERMQKVKAHADLHGDKRVFLGAIAGMIMNDTERLFALKNGFYVIVPSDKTFAITVPEGRYAPREW